MRVTDSLMGKDQTLSSDRTSEKPTQTLTEVERTADLSSIDHEAKPCLNFEESIPAADVHVFLGVNSLCELPTNWAACTVEL